MNYVSENEELSVAFFFSVKCISRNVYVNCIAFQREVYCHLLSVNGWVLWILRIVPTVFPQSMELWRMAILFLLFPRLPSLSFDICDRCLMFHEVIGLFTRANSYQIWWGYASRSFIRLVRARWWKYIPLEVSSGLGNFGENAFLYLQLLT